LSLPERTKRVAADAIFGRVAALGPRTIRMTIPIQRDIFTPRATSMLSWWSKKRPRADPYPVRHAVVPMSGGAELSDLHRLASWLRLNECLGTPKATRCLIFVRANQKAFVFDENCGS
jgi:hypothetical protein